MMMLPLIFKENPQEGLLYMIDWVNLPYTQVNKN